MRATRAAEIVDLETFFAVCVREFGKAAQPTQGIIVLCDNDANCAATLTHIREQIQSSDQDGFPKYGVPAEALQWAESDAGLPKVMILPIPWVGVVGELETLCMPSALQSMGTTNPCVEHFVQCMAADHSCIRPKTRLRMMLAAAWPTNPNVALATVFESAKTSHLVPLNNACFDQLAEFLQSL